MAFGQRIVPFKHAFSRLYPHSALGNRTLSTAFVLQENGLLIVDLDGEQEAIQMLADNPAKRCQPSRVVLAEQNLDRVATPDERFSMRLIIRPFGSRQEYWVEHMDERARRSYRVRLSTEVDPDNPYRPRLAVIPDAELFVVDDDGIIRLFTVRHCMAAGVFQVAHASTDNQIASLAISASGNLLAGLSRWKDIVLFNVPERRLEFVRQIRDDVGWYDQGPGLILLADDARAIITIGTGQPASAPPNTPPVLSVNGYRFVSFPENF